MPVFFVKDTANASAIKKTSNETDFKIVPCVLQSSQNAIEKNTKNGVLKYLSQETSTSWDDGEKGKKYGNEETAFPKYVVFACITDCTSDGQCGQ